MKIKLTCRLFGHDFWTYDRKYTPAYEHLVNSGIIAFTVPSDYQLTKTPSDICYKCGLSKKELGINSISTL